MSWTKEDANTEEWYARYPELESALNAQLAEYENCRRRNPTEQLRYLAGWDHVACPSCAEEARLTEQAGQTCPVLFAQVIAATSLKAIQDLFRVHSDTQCPDCRQSMKGKQGNPTIAGPLCGGGEAA